ncbi:MAG: hypothetical protein U5J63_08100 [Fodinibius sp.]|nr:hypothetical protein [Fodinibius sp.]
MKKHQEKEKSIINQIKDGNFKYLGNQVEKSLKKEKQGMIIL